MLVHGEKGKMEILKKTIEKGLFLSNEKAYTLTLAYPFSFNSLDFQNKIPVYNPPNGTTVKITMGDYLPVKISVKMIKDSGIDDVEGGGEGGRELVPAGGKVCFILFVISAIFRLILKISTSFPF